MEVFGEAGQIPYTANSIEHNPPEKEITHAMIDKETKEIYSAKIFEWFTPITAFKQNNLTFNDFNTDNVGQIHRVLFFFFVDSLSQPAVGSHKEYNCQAKWYYEMKRKDIEKGSMVNLSRHWMEYKRKEKDPTILDQIRFMKSQRDAEAAAERMDEVAVGEPGENEEAEAEALEAELKKKEEEENEARDEHGDDEEGDEEGSDTTGGHLYGDEYEEEDDNPGRAPMPGSPRNISSMEEEYTGMPPTFDTHVFDSEGNRIGEDGRPYPVDENGHTIKQRPRKKNLFIDDGSEPVRKKRKPKKTNDDKAKTKKSKKDDKPKEAAKPKPKVDAQEPGKFRRPAHNDFDLVFINNANKPESKFDVYFEVCLTENTGYASDLDDNVAGYKLIMVPRDLNFTMEEAIEVQIKANSLRTEQHINIIAWLYKHRNKKPTKFADDEVDGMKHHSNLIFNEMSFIEALTGGHVLEDEDFVRGQGSEHVRESIKTYLTDNPGMLINQMRAFNVCEDQIGHSYEPVMEQNADGNFVASGKYKLKFVVPQLVFRLRNTDLFTTMEQRRRIFPWKSLRFSGNMEAFSKKTTLKKLMELSTKNTEQSLSKLLQSYGIKHKNEIGPIVFINQTCLQDLADYARPVFNKMRQDAVNNKDVRDSDIERQRFENFSSMIWRAFIQLFHQDSRLSNAEKAVNLFLNKLFGGKGRPVTQGIGLITTNIDACASTMVAHEYMQLDALAQIFNAHGTVSLVHTLAASSHDHDLSLSGSVCISGTPATAKSYVTKIAQQCTPPGSMQQVTGNSPMALFNPEDIKDMHTTLVLEEGPPVFFDHNIKNLPTDVSREGTMLKAVMTERKYSFKRSVQEPQPDNPRRTKIATKLISAHSLGAFMMTTNLDKLTPPFSRRFTQSKSDELPNDPTRLFPDYMIYQMDDGELHNKSIFTEYMQIKWSLMVIAIKLMNIGILPNVNTQLFSTYMSIFQKQLAKLGVSITDPGFPVKALTLYKMRIIEFAVWYTLFSESSPLRGDLFLTSELDQKLKVEYPNFQMEHILQIAPYLCERADVALRVLIEMFSISVVETETGFLNDVVFAQTRFNVDSIRDAVQAYDHNRYALDPQQPKPEYMRMTPEQVTEARTRNETVKEYMKQRTEDDIYARFMCSSFPYKKPVESRFASMKEIFETDRESEKTKKMTENESFLTDTILVDRTPHMFAEFRQEKALLHTSDAFSRTNIGPHFLIRKRRNNEPDKGEIDPNYIIIGTTKEPRINSNASFVRTIHSKTQKRRQRSLESTCLMLSNLTTQHITAPVLNYVEYDNNTIFTMAQLGRMFHPGELEMQVRTGQIPLQSLRVIDFVPTEDIITKGSSYEGYAVVLLAQSLFMNNGGWVEKCVEACCDAHTWRRGVVVPRPYMGKYPHILQVINMKPTEKEVRIQNPMFRKWNIADTITSDISYNRTESAEVDAAFRDLKSKASALPGYYRVTPEKRFFDLSVSLEEYYINKFNEANRFGDVVNKPREMDLCVRILYGLVDINVAHIVDGEIKPLPIDQKEFDKRMEYRAVFARHPSLSSLSKSTKTLYRTVKLDMVKRRGVYPDDFEDKEFEEAELTKKQTHDYATDLRNIQLPTTQLSPRHAPSQGSVSVKGTSVKRSKRKPLFKSQMKEDDDDIYAHSQESMLMRHGATQEDQDDDEVNDVGAASGY